MTAWAPRVERLSPAERIPALIARWEELQAMTCARTKADVTELLAIADAVMPVLLRERRGV